MIVAERGAIVVSGASEGPIWVYDTMGRTVASGPMANGVFRVPQTGVYMVRIGKHPARKVVVVR